MAGWSIDFMEMRLRAMQEASDFWHALTGGILIWNVTLIRQPPDFFERMEIANLSGATWRG